MSTFFLKKKTKKKPHFNAKIKTQNTILFETFMISKRAFLFFLFYETVTVKCQVSYGRSNSN